MRSTDQGRLSYVIHCRCHRGVLTKMFFRIFGIISGFLTVGITCRLRISGLGLVSRWYHDTDPWYLFWPLQKKVSWYGIMIPTWYQLICSRITWISIITKHDDIGGRYKYSTAGGVVLLVRQEEVCCRISHLPCNGSLFLNDAGIIWYLMIPKNTKILVRMMIHTYFS